MQNYNDIEMPESLKISQFSNQLADLINKTQLSLSIKTYLVKDMLEKLVEANNLIAQKEIQEYEAKLKQLEELNSENIQEVK